MAGAGLTHRMTQANLKLWILPLPPEFQGSSVIIPSIWRLAEVTETSYSWTEVEFYVDGCIYQKSCCL